MLNCQTLSTIRGSRRKSQKVGGLCCDTWLRAHFLHLAPVLWELADQDREEGRVMQVDGVAGYSGRVRTHLALLGGPLD